MKEVKKKKKRKLKVGNFIKFIMTILIVVAFIYYMATLKIQRIVIVGTTRITDTEILEATGLKNYPYMYRYSFKNIKEGMDSIDLVKSYRVYRYPNGTLKLVITEEELLYFKGNQVRTASNTLVDNNHYYGLPTLVGSISEEKETEFVNVFPKVDSSLRSMISEIEYDPSYNEEGTVIDANRFIFRMNDGSKVYISLPNIDKFNKYKEIKETTLENMGTSKGTFYFDSSSDKITFEGETTSEE